MDRLIRWLPWALAAAALLLFVAISPSGLLLAGAWGLAILVARVLAAVATSRDGRLGIDAVFTVVCVLAAFEGGWYVVPAAVAFILADRRAGTGLAPPPLAGTQLELIAGVMSAIVGWLALAFVVWGPTYSSMSSTIGPGGAVDSTTTALSLAAVGITSRTAAVLIGTAILLGVVGVGALIHVRVRVRWAHWAIGLAAIALCVIAFLGAFSIGLYLVPAIGLAILAWWVGRGVVRGHPA
jgi:hypothetical protein